MLYRDWSNFAQTQGEPAGNLETFAQALKKAGFQAVKRGGIRGYLGGWSNGGIELRRLTAFGAGWGGSALKSLRARRSEFPWKPTEPDP